jgi:hypothetical protein
MCCVIGKRLLKALSLFVKKKTKEIFQMALLFKKNILSL